MRSLVYSVFVEGTPRPQPRPRKGKYGNFYNPGTADTWKEAVQAAFLVQRKPFIEKPVNLKIHFFFHKAQGLHGQCLPHTGKPDIDNLVKPVMDAISKMRLWKDDALVKKAEAGKYWTPGKSGAQIWIETEDTDNAR
jgi:Holliday junction resolvase RusA-like endonuclease